MIVIPLLSGLIGVVQRYYNARIGEGIIFDLRVALFAHMQRMSLASSPAPRPRVDVPPK